MTLPSDELLDWTYDDRAVRHGHNPHVNGLVLGDDGLPLMVVTRDELPKA